MSPDAPQDKLVTMANQIARFMASRPVAEQVAGMAAHVNDYWAPPMRAKLAALIDAGTADLHPLVRDIRPHIRLPLDA